MYKLAIFIIIVLICIWVYSHDSFTEDYLYGYWYAEDDEFTEKAGVNSISLFIGEPAGFPKTSRDAQIILDNEITDGLRIEYWRPHVGRAYQMHAKVEFDSHQLWPEYVTIKVDVIRGRMTIKGREDGLVYARLYKHNEITDLTSAK